MLPMFENPLMASNIRKFWARWNLAIKDGLGRVVFPVYKLAIQASSHSAPKKPRAFLQTDTEISESDAHLSDAHLSEAETSTDAPKAASSAAFRSRAATRHTFRPLTPAHFNEKPSRKLSPQPQSPRHASKHKIFFFQVLSGYLTFLISGAFHEYMNYTSYDGDLGWNMLFFAAHATACSLYTGLRRIHPKMLEAIPAPVGVILTLSFVSLTAPLFVHPFLVANFFETLKTVGLFGPVAYFISV